jgi:hypothetical protein
VVPTIAPYATKVGGGTAAAGARFVALSPARLVDTRKNVGLAGALTAGKVRAFQVTGRGGVPSNAVAVTGNLTVVSQTAAGYVSLGPTMTSSPETSTINAPAGDTRANGVTLRLGPGGTLSVVQVAAAGATAHVVFDVTGYLVAGWTGATFVPLAGSRVLDTRSGNGLSGSFRSSTPRAVQVAGRGGIPSGAVAVTANLTVANQTSAGYVSLGPTMGANPTTSTLNVPRGDVRANNVTVKLDGGRLAAVWKGSSGSSAHLVLDVTGYFVAGGSGATFVAIDPVRLLDTRSGNGLSGALADRAPRAFASAARGDARRSVTRRPS